MLDRVPSNNVRTLRDTKPRPDLSQFHATVLKTYTQPHPHLHLSMPSQEAQRVRVKPDYSVETVLRGAIRYDAAAHFTRQLDALIVELSGTCAVCLPAKPLVREETRIRLLMELPLAAERPKLDVEASVVGRDPIEIDGEQGELLTLGFEKLSEVSRYRLRTFAAETLLAEMVAQRSRRGP